MLVSLVDLYLDSATHRWGYPEHALFPDYLPRLLGHLDIAKRLPENYYGLIPQQQATARVSNIALSDPTLSSLRAAGSLHGRRATGRVYDTEAGAEFLRVDGVIVDAPRTQDSGTLTIAAREDATLKELIPRLGLADLYPTADTSNATSRALGVIVVFGTLYKVPLQLVRSDGALSQYDYGVIRKPRSGLLTIQAAYRVDRVIPAGEYTLVESLAGYFVLRFTRPQRTRQGSFEEIRVTLVSTEFATQAEALGWVLSDPTLGLGKSVDAASIASASTTLQSLGIAVSGGLVERVPALEVIEPLLVHGTTLERDAEGDYVPTVDTLDAHPLAPISLGEGDIDWMNLSVSQENEPALDQLPRTYTLEGRFDSGFTGSGSFTLKTARALDGEGTPLEERNRFLGDFGSLDRCADQKAKRLRYSARTIAGTVRHSDGRQLRLGQRVPVYLPNMGHEGEEWEISALTFNGQIAIEVRGFDPALFDYEPDLTATPPPDIALVDYTRTFPGTVSGFTVVATATRVAVDGNTEAVFLVSATAPLVNVSHLVFRAVRSGSASYLPAVDVTVSAGTSATAELSVAAGLAYDLQCYARNTANNDGFQDGPINQLLSVTSPVDTTVLTAPVVLGIDVGQGQMVTVRLAPVDMAVERPFGLFEMWTATSNVLATATLTTQKRGNVFVVGNFTVGTLYYAWFRKLSLSHIPGTWTASTAFTPARIAASDLDASVTGGAAEALKGPPRAYEESTIAPATTANTYGTASIITPASGYTYLGGPVAAVLFSAGTFGAETLTVRLRAAFSDASEAEVLKTFTATGQRSPLDGDDLFTLQPEGKKTVEFRVDAQSTLGTSSARAGVRLVGRNYNG
ncbi:MAG: hypothetical protein ACRDRT_00070 [Pseudonocardiaceae bacterium]